MAFQIQYGHFKYQVVLLDLFNTSASLQGFINKILIKNSNVFIIVYLENILIYTKDPDRPHVKLVS